MSLRTKLLLGYLIFVVALAALGGWSAYRLREMGGVSRRIISDNYASVVAAQDMKESLERQDSAAVFFLLGERDLAAAQVGEHRERFDVAFERAANNITEPGESELIDRIRRDRDDYYRRFDEFLAGLDAPYDARRTGEPRTEVYFGSLKPTFDHLRAEAHELLRLNQDAMVAKSDAAAAVAQTWFLSTLGLAGGLVLAGLALAAALSTRIVRPVRDLTAASKRIAGGDLDTEAKVASRDEIGILATEFNRMAATLRELRRTDLGKIVVAQRQTEAAIDSLYDPVIVTDADGRVTKLNEAAEAIFGSEEAAVGRHVSEVARDDRIAVAVSEALGSRRTVAPEDAAAVLAFRVGGVERAFHLRTSPMRDENSRLLGAVTLLEDVTRLQEVDRLKSEFIATASHELRTPLASVQMGIHLLLEEAAGELEDKQREILYSCREDCERLERLMRDLLDLSRLESGETAPALRPTRVAEVVRTTVERLRPQAEAKDLDLLVEVPPDVPDVVADGSQIERVLTNLLTNAIRHTPKGGEVAVRAAGRDAHVAVSVSDTGRGIPKEYVPRVFEKFVQVPGASAGGAGLGLAISRSIVEAHGGQIVVQSDEGLGTTFTFTLPLADERGHVVEMGQRNKR